MKNIVPTYQMLKKIKSPPSTEDTQKTYFISSDDKKSDNHCSKDDRAAETMKINQENKRETFVNSEGDIGENKPKLTVTTLEKKREKEESQITNYTHVAKKKKIEEVTGKEQRLAKDKNPPIDQTTIAEVTKREDPEICPPAMADGSEKLAFLPSIAAVPILETQPMWSQETASQTKDIVSTETEDMGKASSQNPMPPPEPTKINTVKGLSNGEEKDKDGNETASMPAQDYEKDQMNAQTTPESTATSEIPEENERPPLPPTLAATSSSHFSGNISEPEEDYQSENIVENEASKENNLDIPVAPAVSVGEMEETGFKDDIDVVSNH